jgi:hypothetical protein
LVLSLLLSTMTEYGDGTITDSLGASYYRATAGS